MAEGILPFSYFSSQFPRLAISRPKCNAATRFMSFFRKLFGISSCKPSTTAADQHQTGSAPVKQTISEAMRAWIRQGGLVAPVSIQSRIPPSTKTKQDLDHLVADALAEFDVLHPDRRIAESAAVTFDPSNISAPIEVSVNLKFSSPADFRANIEVEKAFFDIFEKRELPFKG